MPFHLAAPSCDMFNLGSSYFHVPLTTVRHLLNVVYFAQTIQEKCKQKHVKQHNCNIRVNYKSYDRLKKCLLEKTENSAYDVAYYVSLSKNGQKKIKSLVDRLVKRKSNLGVRVFEVWSVETVGLCFMVILFNNFFFLFVDGDFLHHLSSI